MYDYTIYPEADRERFYKQCQKIERQVNGLKKYETIETFDDTLIQIYQYPRGEIVVKNDELTGALYVKSDIDLAQFDALLF